MKDCNTRDTLKINAFAMIVFGGVGDLSRRKLLPAIYHLFITDKLPKEFVIIGLGRRSFSDDTFRSQIISSLQEFVSEDFNPKKADAFSRHLFYLSGDSIETDFYKRLCEYQKNLPTPVQDNILYYLSVPPKLLQDIVSGLQSADLCAPRRRKIIIEKPFGRDKASASQLNNLLLKAFEENQIYRIDHYLGKETVQNILFFRFGNSIFEPLWNRRYIDHVQIMVAEDLGIEHRGQFYEQTGVIRDIVQNHIMQLMALVAMEPPAEFDANRIRDEKVKVYHSFRPMNPKEIRQFTVLGQYGRGKIRNNPVQGYREEKQVSPDSITSTFFTGKFYLDNWRWANVPFYIRTGKRLPRRVSEIYVAFKQPPLRLFGSACDTFENNSLSFNIQPQEEITMRFSVKTPGIDNTPHPVNMRFNYEDNFRARQNPPYERLIVDCIKGDLTLFARQDGVEAMWDIVDPIIRYWDAHPPRDFPNYPSGSWGPKESNTLIENDGKQWRFDSN